MFLVFSHGNNKSFYLLALIIFNLRVWPFVTNTGMNFIMIIMLGNLTIEKLKY